MYHLYTTCVCMTISVVSMYAHSQTQRGDWTHDERTHRDNEKSVCVCVCRTCVCPFTMCVQFTYMFTLFCM